MSYKNKKSTRKWECILIFRAAKLQHSTDVAFLWPLTNHPMVLLGQKWQKK